MGKTTHLHASKSIDALSNKQTGEAERERCAFVAPLWLKLSQPQDHGKLGAWQNESRPTVSFSCPFVTDWIQMEPAFPLFPWFFLGFLVSASFLGSRVLPAFEGPGRWIGGWGYLPILVPHQALSTLEESSPQTFVFVSFPQKCDLLAVLWLVTLLVTIKP